MLRALDYRERPDRLLAELEGELAGREVDSDIAFAIRDYLRLSEKAAARPRIAEWMETLRGERRQPGPRSCPRALDKHQGPGLAYRRPQPRLPRRSGRAGPRRRRRRRGSRRSGLADRPISSDPAHHRRRRRRLDPGQARSDPRRSGADLHRAQRLRRRQGPGGGRSRPSWRATRFARPFAAARTNIAPATIGRRTTAIWRPTAAAGSASAPTPGRSSTGCRSRPGSHCRARRPCPRRSGSTSPSPTSPAPSSSSDDRAADAVARDLAGLLPQMRRDWHAIAAASPARPHRFAEYFAMAKLPGLRTDLIAFSYTRPDGTVTDFQGRWADWMIVPRGTADSAGELPEAASLSGRLLERRHRRADRPHLPRSLRPLGLPAPPPRLRRGGAARGRGRAPRPSAPTARKTRFRRARLRLGRGAGLCRGPSQRPALAGDALPADPGRPLGRAITTISAAAPSSSCTRATPSPSWAKRSPYYYDD